MEFQYFEAHLVVIYRMRLFLVYQSGPELSFTRVHCGEQVMTAQKIDRQTAFVSLSHVLHLSVYF